MITSIHKLRSIYRTKLTLASETQSPQLVLKWNRLMFQNRVLNTI